MNVPPLMTAAVSATANAPSDRLPRKYFSRKLPFRSAKLATTPRPSEIKVKSTSAIKVGGCAWIPVTLSMQASLANVLLELGCVILAEFVVLHEVPREPDREDGTHRPRNHDSPEHPGRHPQDGPNVFGAERTVRPDITEQVAVGAAVGHRHKPGDADDDRLAAGVDQDRVGLSGHGGGSPLERDGRRDESTRRLANVARANEERVPASDSCFRTLAPATQADE